METLNKDFIKSLLQQNYSLKDISVLLENKYPNIRGFSLRSVERYCNIHGLSSRLKKETLESIVSDAVQEVITYKFCI